MRLNEVLLLAAAICAAIALPREAYAQCDGLLPRGGHKLFPIGVWALPKDDVALRAMADAGINLVRCGNRADLDRVQAAGTMGCIALPLDQGATDSLRQRVGAVQDHPALAVWEGPDEIVWSFTADSGLQAKAGILRSDWWAQAPKAVTYANGEARRIIPNMRDAIRLVRSLDANHRPIWINEARESDVKFVREYLDFIDITGCDDYPVKKDARPLARVGVSTELWKQIGGGKPVWMILQAFSWHALGGAERGQVAYPSFAESRFMAYDVIVRGARGIVYFGTDRVEPESGFMDALHAVTSELAALQPFLVAPGEQGARVTLIEFEPEEPLKGVRMTVRRSGGEWLIVLVNEDDRRHMAVEVSGLNGLDGQSLDLLYGSETVTVENGGFITRMPPYEVKVFATGREWETARRQGRDFKQ